MISSIDHHTGPKQERPSPVARKPAGSQQARNFEYSPYRYTAQVSKLTGRAALSYRRKIRCKSGRILTKRAGAVMPRLARCLISRLYLRQLLTTAPFSLQRSSPVRCHNSRRQSWHLLPPMLEWMRQIHQEWNRRSRNLRLLLECRHSV